MASGGKRFKDRLALSRTKLAHVNFVHLHDLTCIYVEISLPCLVCALRFLSPQLISD